MFKATEEVAVGAALVLVCAIDVCTSARSEARANDSIVSTKAVPEKANAEVGARVLIPAALRAYIPATE